MSASPLTRAELVDTVRNLRGVSLRAGTPDASTRTHKTTMASPPPAWPPPAMPGAVSINAVERLSQTMVIVLALQASGYIMKRSGFLPNEALGLPAQ